MISYITASHDKEILRDNLEATLRFFDDDELIVLEHPPSIAVAYNEGQRQARNPIRCYVHHDVQILHLTTLRAQLIEHATEKVGIVGIIGSRRSRLPWWDSDERCGSIQDARRETPLDFGPGGSCGFLDGVLLASAQDLTWDERYPGFDLYDHDICLQMLKQGLSNYCLDDGKSLVVHNNRGSSALIDRPMFLANCQLFRSKWDGNALA